MAGQLSQRRVEPTPNDEQRLFDVLIVGAGLAGIGMAIQLRAAGFDNFAILEKSDQSGGTWRQNTYPGCACDVASAMYSYSFAPNPRWSRMYAGQPEILEYIHSVSHRHGIEPHIRFGTEVVAYDFVDGSDQWQLRTRSGDTYLGRSVVIAHGALHKPLRPVFPGQENFAGTIFHSAEWDHTADLTGKRVAVIGTGASAAQFVPEIVDAVERLDVYQRTAHWLLPKADRPISARQKAVFARLPFLQRIVRGIAYWTHEVPVLGFMHPTLLGILKWVAMRTLRKQVPDAELRAKLTPKYTIGCKRILLSNDFYPALSRANVDVVTAPIAEFTPTGIRTVDGRTREADVVILGTGFATDNRCAQERIVGRDGITIQDAWSEGMTAYLGMTVAGFPNLFMIMGPNSGGGAQSILFVIEAQIRYIIASLRMMADRQATRIEVRAEIQREFNAWLHRKLSRTVWNSGGCTSWFLDRNGHNRQSWPGTGTSYWRATRTPDPQSFEFTLRHSHHDDPVPASGGVIPTAT